VRNTPRVILKIHVILTIQTTLSELAGWRGLCVTGARVWLRGFVLAGRQLGETFGVTGLKENLRFAEDPLTEAKAIVTRWSPWCSRATFGKARSDSWLNKGGGGPIYGVAEPLVSVNESREAPRGKRLYAYSSILKYAL
jgi:hypothetical protein